MYSKRQSIQAVLNDLVYNRIVRRQSISGESYYELTHEYLIDTIEEWISEEERELRNARALLDFEMKISKIYKSYIPLSRAELIQNYSSQIKMSEEERELVEKSIQKGYEEIEEKKNLEEQLRIAQKMESIGVLAGGVAHDLNNIFSVLIGHSELLRLHLETQKDSKGIKSINVVTEVSNRATKIVNQLLTFSRRGRADTKQVDINELIDQISNLIQRSFAPEYELEIEKEEDIWIIEVDPDEIEQVIMNLCLNAKDAMPSGGVIKICTKNIEISQPKYEGIIQPGKYIELSVIDHGIGIAEKYRDKIFEPFFTTKEIGKGTGLGLSIVYGIIRKYNGNIDIQSKEGKGSIFKIYIPSVGIPMKAYESRDYKKLDLTSKGETILLVEDEHLILEFTKEILLTFGYNVITAQDGYEAIKQFKKMRGKINLIIMDSSLPKMSGREAAETILREDPNVKIVFSTGYSLDYERDRLRSYDKVKILQKPYDSNQLFHLIRLVLDSD